MDFFEAVKKRASVRAFVPCRVDDADMEQILDAARRAPSGYNRQPCSFIVVREKATLEKLGAIQECIAGASAAVGVVVDSEVTQFWKEDAAAAIENMLLAITALDYASLWVEGRVLSQEELAKEILGVPESLRLLAVLPIGKPADKAQQAEKKPLAELVHWERYGG